MVIVSSSVPEGRPKSGRIWKVKQKTRASAQLRTGLLKNLTKTYEERRVIREQRELVINLERSMKEDAKQKRIESVAKRNEHKKRLMEAEFKNTSYQSINPEKLKSMSKKQLRMVRKTSVNKNGQVELINPWQSNQSFNSSPTPKRKR